MFDVGSVAVQLGSSRGEQQGSSMAMPVSLWRGRELLFAGLCGCSRQMCMHGMMSDLNAGTLHEPGLERQAGICLGGGFWCLQCATAACDGQVVLDS